MENPKIRQDAEETVPLKKEKDKRQKLTTREKFKSLKGNITVEPCLAFFMITSVVTMLGTQNLNLEKACRVNLKLNDTICTALTLRQRENLTQEEDEVQKLVASVEGWKSVIHTAFPVILMMFIGAWSDRTGRRKVCILMPVAGECITCVLNLINTYFFYEVSVEWTALMGTIFLSVTGAWYTMFLGTFSYIVDISSKQTRTFRLGVLTFGITIGLPVGMGLSGILLRFLGFYGLYGVCALVQLSNFLYIYFLIEDHRWLDNNYKSKRKGIIGFFIEFFNFQSLKETLQILTEKGNNSRRLKVCLILLMVCLNFGSFWGETSITYIFCRYRFNWDELKYSIYSIYSLTLHTIGTMIAIGLFSKKLKVDDSVLGIMAITSRISGALVWAFAENTMQIYIAPLVELLNGTTVIALRSIASKLVPAHELAKVYSLFGLAETIVPLISAPLYTRVYISTLHLLPGAVFLVSVMTATPILLIFIWFFIQHKKNIRRTELNVQENEKS
ncbi:proton-coupled folate transporter-like [Aricia agestis]|uniref:proton-coupled folate transporter-like n=1 Tax=Aricia agestis TaxID=91739 RepID=UPI001C204AD9|nr:proton-coupled folate transporter-like [Aricia agestis]